MIGLCNLTALRRRWIVRRRDVCSPCDHSFKTIAVLSAQGAELAKLLHELEIHLMLWHAKFAYWIPQNGSRHPQSL